MYSIIKDGKLKKFDERDLVNGHYTVPEDVTEICERAFKDAKTISSITIPGNVKKIGHEAFKSVKSLIEVNIEEGLEIIDAGAFEGSGITKIVLPTSLKEWGFSCFKDCKSLKEISIPETLTYIPGCAFEGSGIERISLPKSITVIECFAFKKSELKEITIHAGVEEIEWYAFAGSKLESAIFEKGSKIKVISGALFESCRKLKQVILDEGIEIIGYRAFEECTSLEYVNIPSSVSRIKGCAFKRTGLKEITIPKNVEYIEEKTFSWCENLERVYLPAELKGIHEQAFSVCKALKHIELPNGLLEIHAHAFSSAGIEEINIPDSVKYLGHGAFCSCKELKQIQLPSGLEKIPNSLLFECVKLEKIKIPEGVKVIDNCAFGFCESLAEVQLPDSLTSILVGAFEECKKLEEIVIPEGVEIIDTEAFLCCSSLKRITLPSALKNLGYRVFAACNALEKISLDKERCLEIIGLGLFERCPENLQIELFGGTKQLSLYRYKVFESVFNANPTFLRYALEHKRAFLPKNLGIVKSTHPDEVSAFYAHSKDWKEVLDIYLETFKITGNDAAVTCLYRMCVVLGLFQDGKSETAKSFIKENILTMNPRTLYSFTHAINTRVHGYKDEFARFFMRNFHAPIIMKLNGIDPEDLEKEDTIEVPFLHAYDENDEERINYVARAYHEWEKIKEAFPNKEVVADRETSSERTNITEEDVIGYLYEEVYFDVDPGCEKLAQLCGRYRYTQEEYDTLEKWFLQAKDIKAEEMKLFCEKDTAEKGIKFELMAKDNEETAIIGEKTNCCQTVDDAGAECLHYGMVKPNSGFIKFTLGDRLIGQGWVWYNEETKEICIDNIEIPARYVQKINKDERYYNSFVECLLRLVTAFEQAMLNNGLEVQRVTLGKGYTKLSSLDDVLPGFVPGDDQCLPSDYNYNFIEIGSVYSDALAYRYILSGLKLSDIIDTSKVL